MPVKNKVDVVSALASDGRWDVLIEFDQLRNRLHSIEVSHVHPPRASSKHVLAKVSDDFNEAEICFVPSYGFAVQYMVSVTSHATQSYIPSGQYTFESGLPAAAWADRVLYHTRDTDTLQCVVYDSAPVHVTEHMPVMAAFTVSVLNLAAGAASKV